MAKLVLKQSVKAHGPLVFKSYPKVFTPPMSSYLNGLTKVLFQIFEALRNYCFKTISDFTIAFYGRGLYLRVLYHIKVF